MTRAYAIDLHDGPRQRRIIRNYTSGRVAVYAGARMLVDLAPDERAVFDPALTGWRQIEKEPAHGRS